MRAAFAISCTGLIVLGVIIACYILTYVSGSGLLSEEFLVHGSRVIFWMPASFFSLFGLSEEVSFLLCYPLWGYVAFSLIFFSFCAFRNFRFE